MAKREYSGPAIDATEQYVTERNTDGETVAGTSEDDNHDENTEAWPSALDRDDFTATEADAIERLCIHPDSSYSAVAEAVGCSDAMVYKARQKIKEQGKEDSVPFAVERDPKQAGKERGGKKGDDSVPEVSETGSVKEWFIEVMAAHPDESRSEIASRIPDAKDWSGQNYYNVMREGKGRKELKRRILEKGNWDKAAGKIREKLQEVEIEREAETETGGEIDTAEKTTQDVPEQGATTEATSRVDDLEETVATLTQALVSDCANNELISQIVSQVDSETIANSAIEVVVDE